MRYEDWPSRLNAIICEALDRPFAYGEHDCSLFAADVVLALTGVDPAQQFRGKYRTEQAAYRLLARSGGLAAVAQSVAREHGFEPVLPTLAQRGDVVLFHNDGRPTLGVVDLAGRIAAPGPQGLAFLPITEAIMAWRV